MISFKHKFIFIHMPRTAGTSIENALNTYSEDRVNGLTIRPSKILIDLAKNKDINISNYKHFTYNSYKKILEEEIKDFFVFSVIRTPYERIPSVYYYSKITNSSLAKFIVYSGNQLNGTAGNTIEKFIGSAENIFLLKFKNLKKDWLELLNKLNLPDIPLDKINTGKRINYDILYKDVRLSEIISKVFFKELEKYFLEEEVTIVDTHVVEDIEKIEGKVWNK